MWVHLSQVLMFQLLSWEQMVWQPDLGLWDVSRSWGRREGLPSSAAFKAATSWQLSWPGSGGSEPPLFAVPTPVFILLSHFNKLPLHSFPLIQIQEKIPKEKPERHKGLDFCGCGQQVRLQKPSPP